MAVLTMAKRKRIPESEFALPGKGEGPSGKGAGSYPIPDASHARNALARVSQHGSPEEKSKVRAKVKARFPNIGKKGKKKAAARREEEKEGTNTLGSRA